MSIEIKLGYDSLEAIRQLFQEYTEFLIQGDALFKDYLAVQNYEDELNQLEAKYGLPKGRLYLTYVNQTLAGCIGLKFIDDQTCEMKRLYVRPKFRNKQIARRLIDQIIEDAKEIGYQSMMLDTLPFLQSAIHLYKQYGFYEVPSYNNSPMDSSIYMKLDL